MSNERKPASPAEMISGIASSKGAARTVSEARIARIVNEERTKYTSEEETEVHSEIDKFADRMKEIARKGQFEQERVAELIPFFVGVAENNTGEEAKQRIEQRERQNAF